MSARVVLLFVAWLVALDGALLLNGYVMNTHAAKAVAR